MIFIRPIARRDLADMMQLAVKSGIGLTSLPEDEVTLAARIERSLQTWQGELAKADQCYLFVLVDGQSDRVVGICAIEVAVGLSEPLYSYRIGNQVHASKNLQVYNSLQTLMLANDHVGAAELCTLFLDADYRYGSYGKLLSKVRMLFIAAFRQYFGQQLIAVMRGVSDEQGNSPFWQHVGRHFFPVEFTRADYLSGTGHKTCIAELMPKLPLYLDFIHPDAQNIIGQVHPHTAPARKVLETEGLRHKASVDIFDGGPTLEAEIDHLRAIQESRLVATQQDDSPEDESAPVYLVANDDYLNYRAILVHTHFIEPPLRLTGAQIATLGIAPQSQVRIIRLNPQENS